MRHARCIFQVQGTHLAGAFTQPGNYSVVLEVSGTYTCVGPLSPAPETCSLALRPARELLFDRGDASLDELLQAHVNLPTIARETLVSSIEASFES
jgi:hypothetical protein